MRIPFLRAFCTLAFFLTFLVAACSDNSVTQPSIQPENPSSPEVDTRTKILFIGNSYTGYHDMPGIFEQIAISCGKDVFVDKSITYNKRLPYFFHDSLTMAKIHSRNWDYVIYQQAQYLTDAYDRLYDHLEISMKLDSVIHANYSETNIILFMEQAYAKGDDTYSINDTFEKMTERVIKGSLRWAKLLGNPIVSPVAAAWAEVYKANPDWRFQCLLHDPVDGAHPTLHGAYVTACTFYATIFKEEVKSNYNPGVDETFLIETQKVVSNLVLNNYSKWFID